MARVRRFFTLGLAAGVLCGLLACGGSTATVGGDPADGAPGDGALGSPDGSGAPDGGGAQDGGGSSDGATDADLDAAPWTPKQLPGLSVWLDDTVGVVIDPAKPGRVKRWLDQSGLGNTAEGGGGDGVTMSPSLDPAAVGGKDAIACDRQTYFRIPSVPSLQFGTGDFAIVTVAKVTTLGRLFEKTAAITVDVTADATMRLRTGGVGGGTALLAGTPTDAFTLVVARGAALRLQVGANSVVGPVSTADVSTGINAPVTLCQSSISKKISLAEVIIVKGPLSDPDLAKLTGYLRSKFTL